MQCGPHFDPTPPPPRYFPVFALPLIGSPSASVKAVVGGIQTIHSCSFRCGRNATADQDPGRQQCGRGSINSVHRRTRLCQRDSDDKPNLSTPTLLFIQENFQFVSESITVRWSVRSSSRHARCKSAWIADKDARFRLLVQREETARS